MLQQVRENTLEMNEKIEILSKEIENVKKGNLGKENLLTPNQK